MEPAGTGAAAAMSGSGGAAGSGAGGSAGSGAGSSGALQGGSAGALAMTAGTSGASANSGSAGVLGSAGFGGGTAGGGSGGVSPGGAGGIDGGAGTSLGGAGASFGGAGASVGGAGASVGGAGASFGGSGGQSGSGAAGAAASANGPFVCNQATGGKLMDELFIGGLESGLDGARWQLKWKDFAAIEAWADPESAFWDAPIESACANGSTSPDRVVFMIFSWTVTSQADWRTKITQAVNNFRAKYAGLLRIDFMSQIRGPDNMLCPTPPAAGETIVASPELQAAMQEVAADFPGFVFLSPGWEASSCSDFQGGGPHLTTAGNMTAASPAATYFALTQ